MHARTYIAENLIYQRYIGASDLRKMLGRQTGECTWCKGFVKHKMGRWCSEACRKEGYIRSGYVLVHVRERDKGVCALCGLDTVSLKKRFVRLWDRCKEKRLCYSFDRLRKWSRLTGVSHNMEPFDMDHILPVSEGGGCCGLDNYRTLCKKCHKKISAEGVARLAKARKVSKP